MMVPGVVCGHGELVCATTNGAKGHAYSAARARRCELRVAEDDLEMIPPAKNTQHSQWRALVLVERARDGARAGCVRSQTQSVRVGSAAVQVVGIESRRDPARQAKATRAPFEMNIA